MKDPDYCYAKLVGLLFGDDITRVVWPSHRNVFSHALREIQDLQGKLDRQSTCLAEALREKNNAIEKVNSYKFSYGGVDWEAVGKELAIPWGASITGNLLIYLRNWKSKTEARLLELTRENDQMRAELAQLRPKPKFRVNQVVIRRGDHFELGKIVERRWDAISKIWCYSWVFRNGMGSGIPETSLRALTDEEK